MPAVRVRHVTQRDHRGGKRDAAKGRAGFARPRLHHRRHLVQKQRDGDGQDGDGRHDDPPRRVERGYLHDGHGHRPHDEHPRPLAQPRASSWRIRLDLVTLVSTRPRSEPSEVQLRKVLRHVDHLRHRVQVERGELRDLHRPARPRSPVPRDSRVSVCAFQREVMKSLRRHRRIRRQPRVLEVDPADDEPGPVRRGRGVGEEDGAPEPPARG